MSGSDLIFGITIRAHRSTTLIFARVVTCAKKIFTSSFLADSASKPTQSPAPTCD